MTKLSKSLLFGLFAAILIGFSGTASAYYPTLSVYSATGGGTTISISGGQPNATVVINYTPSGSNLTSSVTGLTDYSGNFTTMIQSAIGSQVTATVAGQQVYANSSSNNNGGCGYYGCPPPIVGGFSLSQTSLNLSVGQSASVTANYPYLVNSYNNNIYISSNSNTYVASASVSGNQVMVNGLASGSTTISVCSASSGGACANLYVTVGGNNNCGYYGCGTGSLSLSQSSITVSAGQSSAVTVYGNNNGSLYISNNSNSSVASASISGNQISVYGITSGSTTMSICQSNYSSSCVSLYVTVSGGTNYGNIYLSPSSLSLSLGQSSTVTINNGSYSYGSYYISSNSNSSVAAASITGSSLYVNAQNVGNTNILVCQSGSSNSCATLVVSVSGVLGANTNLWFSPASPTLYVGQNLAVSINSSAYAATYPYNNTAYYISSNSNSSVVTATVSGTVLNLYANQNGSSTITVCSSALSFCGTLYVTVGGNNNCGYYGCGTGSLSLSQTSITLNQGQSMAVTANNVPALYVSSNSNPGTVSVNLSGNQATFYGQSSGSSSIVLCGVSSSQCATVYVTVNGGYGSSNIILSQYSLSLSVGQNATINVSGNGGYGYYIGTNSNPGVISASFNGSVINIYAIANGTSNLQICQNSASSCANLTVTVGNGTVLGASTYPSGQLISEGSTVYIVYKNTKTAFASASAFLGLGFKFGNVLNAGNSGLVFSGHTVTTSAGPHPWGSWIKSGTTVYFVSESGLIPVPDWNTFLNNGGQSNMIAPANIYDFRLPLLTPMTTGDYRVR